MSVNEAFTDCGRVVARVVRDPLSPSPVLELAQFALALKQRLDLLETSQRALEERLAKLETAEQER